MEETLGLVSDERRTGDRRCRRWSFVLHERRTGFDRRSLAGSGVAVPFLDNALTGLRDRPRVLWLMLAAVNFLNLADFALTLNVLASGGGEANPIMRSLLSLNPVWAGTLKVGAVLLATAIIWRCRRFRSALLAAILIAVVFAAVLFYHIWGLAALS